MSKPKLQFVPIDKIWFDKRFREEMGDIKGLSESIKEKGVIQPITLQADFKLCAGGRRLEAAKLAGLKEIPALVRDNKGDEVDMREIELIENTFRSDFTWQEKVKLIAELDRLMRAKDSEWSTRKTAQLMGESHPMNVSRALNLAEAIEMIPDIAKSKTADEANKILKRFQETVVTAEMRRRQDERQEEGMDAMLEVAKRSYIIGDVFKGLVGLKPGHPTIRFIEVDPPYGINLNEQKKQADGTSIVETYKEIDVAGYTAFIQILAEETYRVSVQDTWMIFWYGPTHHHMIQQSLMKAGWLVDEIPAIWTKGGGQTNAPEVHLARSYEPFFVCRKGRPILRKRGRSNVFDFAPVAGVKKYHPTERPLDLMVELLDTFVLEGDGATVLVPFLGSGVTLRACYLRGLQCMGWDLNGEYRDKFLLAVEEDTKVMNAKGD